MSGHLTEWRRTRQNRLQAIRSASSTQGVVQASSGAL
jgi:hypothetical protein